MPGYQTDRRLIVSMRRSPVEHAPPRWMDVMQGELFEPATFVLRDGLVGKDGRAPLIVVGCGRKKLPIAAPARNLYISDRFRKSMALMCDLAAPFVILSAKHGVVEPDRVLEPYDLDVSALSDADQRSWAEQAIDQLAHHAKGRTVSVLAIGAYARPLLEANRARPQALEIVFPWLELEAPDRLVWLHEARRMAARIADLDRFYGWIDAERGAGRTFSFADLSTNAVPKRGVYIFLDPTEPNFRSMRPRVVRIGTHAVSAGSQASLRGRLRTHLGPANEIGNHRGSIFRLHVGRAMLEAGLGHASLPTWGEGQDASPEVKALEQAHEIAVSRYLQRLQVVLLDINDGPSKDSMRARVEMGLIALFSDSMRPIDLPSSGWLGLKSPVAPIRLSGLWNIRGIGGKYDSSWKNLFSSLLEA